MGVLMILGAMLSVTVAPGRVSQSKLVLSEGPDKAQFKDLYNVEYKHGLARKHGSVLVWAHHPQEEL